MLKDISKVREQTKAFKLCFNPWLENPGSHEAGGFSYEAVCESMPIQNLNIQKQIKFCLDCD